MKLYALLLTLTVAFPTNALVIHELEITEVVPATAQHAEMQLKGASVRRAYGIVDTYVGVLYVADPNLSDEKLISADAARRMVFHVVSSRVSARRFTNAINEGLSINIDRETMKTIKPRVDKLVSLFDHKFVEGTIGYIQWNPEQQQSHIVIDGVEKGTVKGKDLNDAMLKIWIGEQPVSERFKAEVLGHSYSQKKIDRRK